MLSYETSSSGIIQSKELYHFDDLLSKQSDLGSVLPLRKNPSVGPGSKQLLDLRKKEDVKILTNFVEEQFNSESESRS